MSPLTNTLIIGKVLHELNSCDSTNNYAKDLIAKSKPLEGSVVITDKQTAGRGQFGNSWEGEAGKNITISIILYPNLAVAEQFYLSKIVSLACVEALKSISNLDFKIKWPNDIYYGKQKIGGILIENQVSGSKLANAVVGIGINLNQENFEGLENANSLFNLVRYVLNRKKCTEILLEHIDAQYLKLRSKDFAGIDKSYHAKLLSYGEEFNYLENSLPKKALLLEVNAAGQLKVEVEGKEHLFNFKEIEWVL
ncbi:MAG: biotin--[acetyl-CoA-carboxylase] ligase [Chitinophagales bacterium]|nr:biotin--[acetyl-CoA-carboxylase] ligase [Bacteroidota bacterium]